MSDYKDQVYLDHVLEQVALIEEKFASGNAKESFLEDVFFRYGVYYALQTLSESTQHLSDSIKETEPNIPWKQIGGFRNILVHDYLGDIQPETILDVIDHHLIILKQAVQRMKEKL